MFFYGVTDLKRSPFKPLVRFEAKNLDDAIDYFERLKKAYGNNYIVHLFKYQGYKRKSGVLCIQGLITSDGRWVTRETKNEKEI